MIPTKQALLAAAGTLLLLPAALHADPVVLPASSALPLGSSTTRGMLVRTVQAPLEEVVANSYGRAYRQLNGTLLDEGGNPVENQAAAGTNTDGSYTVDTVNFEKDAQFFDLTDAQGNYLTSFFADYFPGIDSLGNHANNFALEVVTFLELPAGVTTLGVSTGTDRTDVNNDDSFMVFVGTNPREFFNEPVGMFQRNAPAFTSNTKNETQFEVQAPQAGIYPFRIVYWQTGLGANLQFYSVDTQFSIRKLVNDPFDSSAIPAYIDNNAAAANAAYLAEVSPTSGSAGNASDLPIEAVIVDRGSTVATSDIRLLLNGEEVTPDVLEKADGKTTVRYNPDPNRTNADNLVVLEVTDSASTLRTYTWDFAIQTSGGSSTRVAGQWDFDEGDLRGTVGTALSYLGGPEGMTAQGTLFGTTEAFGLAPIAGESAMVMEVPGDLSNQIGYVMIHGISPNGGGTRVNQYTLIMDVFVEASGPGAAALWQTSSAENTDDGDLFWQGNNFGQGGEGYNGRGSFTAGEWHRIVAAYDMAANPPLVAKFVDGIKQDDWTANQGLDNPRRSLGATAVLFGDGDADERRRMWVNSVQIREGRVSDAEAVVLGGPSADGIPMSIPSSNVTGQWDFNFGDLGASIGSDLAYLDGSDGMTATGTVFGSTDDFFEITGIDGQSAQVMRVPPDLSNQIGYVVDHRIAPNGGGTRVNQYTLVMDVFVATTGPGAASLWQTSSAENTDDGDLFWQGNNFGQGGEGYNGRGTFTAGEWHRVVAIYDMAASTPVVVKYVDGIKQHEWTANQGLDNPRRSLGPLAVLFGDGDADERREMWVNAVQIRSGRITDAEAVLLGGPSADGIPVVIPSSTVRGQWDFAFADLGATIGANLAYLDGAEGLTATGTMFGLVSEFPELPALPGGDANIMRVPPDLSNQIGYVVDHRISPNGGGTRVNQYTLIMDVLVATTGPGAAALWQTSSAENTDDGDLFWQGDNFGQGGEGYNGVGTFTAGEWHRVVAAYNMAANPPVVVKYVDGIYQADWTANQGLDNPRRSLGPLAVLFADGDADERREMWVSSVQIREGALSNIEIEALGGPTADGIPVDTGVEVTPPTEAPSLTIALGEGTVTITWPSDITGFVIESAPTVDAETWTPVEGVTDNSVTLTVSGDGLYLRLRAN